jgi:hypothetical protein
MNRTVSALYETRADAERALEALRAHNLAEHAEIHDREGSDSEAGHGAQGRLRHLFGGHKDHHTYGEGLRRGHVLLTARVDDTQETRAAELMDAAQPMNVAEHEAAWRREGWTPAETPAVDGATSGTGEYDSPTAYGSRIAVRSYVVGSGIDYSQA